MSKYSHVIYNPSLSVAENSIQNNLTEKEMRYYIRSRGIDRRNSERQPYISKIKEYLKEHPDATKIGAAKSLGLGINTIRKYWSVAKNDGEVEPNKTKATIRQQREQKTIAFLDSLSIDYLKNYIAKREANNVAPETTTEACSSLSIPNQQRAIILDFDKTLFNTSVDNEARENKDWDKVYSLIPQYELYEGWREVLKWTKENNIKVAIISGAKTELITKTLEYHKVEVDAVVGYQFMKPKPSRRLVNLALKKLGGILRKNVISIGDHILDRDMSHNGRVRFVGAVWDCQHPEHAEELRKGETISSPIEVIDLLKRMEVVELPENTYKVVQYNERTSKSQSPFYGEIAYNDTHVYFYQGVSLSNWAISVPAIPYEGHKFNSSEALFMYLKCKGMGSENVALEIVRTDNDDSLTGNAKFDAVKKLGRKAKFKNAIYMEKREEWMYLALKAKYEADEEFRRTLMDERYRGKQFVEAADADDIWGIGTYITDEVLAFNEEVWMGTNLLGKTLTRVRDEHM